jgi:single-strand DNA-binding protein
MNKVLITGRLTRDPELRSLASGKAVTQFVVASNEYPGGKERTEYHNIVTWDRLAEICGQYLAKGQQVALEGRLQTRQWDDADGKRHWKTEIVAAQVEMPAPTSTRETVSPRFAGRTWPRASRSPSRVGSRRASGTTRTASATGRRRSSRRRSRCSPVGARRTTPPRPAPTRSSRRPPRSTASPLPRLRSPDPRPTSRRPTARHRPTPPSSRRTIGIPTGRGLPLPRPVALWLMSMKPRRTRTTAARWVEPQGSLTARPAELTDEATLALQQPRQPMTIWIGRSAHSHSTHSL